MVGIRQSAILPPATNFAACDRSGKCSEILRPQLSYYLKNYESCPPWHLLLFTVASGSTGVSTILLNSQKCVFIGLNKAHVNVSPYFSRRVDGRVQGLGDRGTEAGVLCLGAVSQVGKGCWRWGGGGWSLGRAAWGGMMSLRMKKVTLSRWWAERYWRSLSRLMWLFL